MLASVPPVSRDALTHHLYVPKLYLNDAGIYNDPELIFSYYPMNLELLYLIPLSMGNDLVPKYIHFLFALGTAYVIWRHVYGRLNRWYAISAVLLFLSIPIIVKLSITAYVDLGLVFFSTVSLLWVIKWLDSGFKTKYLVISALFCGLGLGTKYNGLITFFILTVFVVYLRSKYSSEQKNTKPLVDGLTFLIISLLVFSPWMIRNFSLMGNPIYPLFNRLFNPGSEPIGNELSHFLIRHLNYNESWLEMSLIPFRIFFQGEDGNPKYFDGRLNPILFIFPFLSLCLSRVEDSHHREKYILLFFSVIYILFVFFRRDMRVRYVVPVIPHLVILSLYGVHESIERIRRIEKPTAAIICKFALFLCLSVLMMKNVQYLIEQFQYVEPAGYITGEVERDDYIERYRHEYPIIQYANENLPGKPTILALFLGKRGYYSDHKIFFNEMILKKCIEGNISSSQILGCLKRGRITHLIIRVDLFNKWLEDNFEAPDLEKLSDFLRRNVSLLYSKHAYMLFSLESQQN